MVRCPLRCGKIQQTESALNDNRDLARAIAMRAKGRAALAAAEAATAAAVAAAAAGAVRASRAPVMTVPVVVVAAAAPQGGKS